MRVMYIFKLQTNCPSASSHKFENKWLSKVVLTSQLW